MLQTSWQAQAELHQHHPLLLLCHASRCARRHVLHAQALDSCLVETSGWTACAAVMNALVDYESRATVCVPALQARASDRQSGVADRVRASELMLSATFSMAAWQQADGSCSGRQRCKQGTNHGAGELGCTCALLYTQSPIPGVPGMAAADDA